MTTHTFAQTHPPLSAQRAFACLVKHGSMTAAAEALGVSVSAVSHQVTALERYLGAQLVERLGNRVQPTRLGAVYGARLVPAFDQLLDAGLGLFTRQEPHQLTVTTYPLFAVKWLLPRLHSFYRRHPGLELTLVSSNAVLDLDAGSIDVAIRLGPQKDWGRYQVESLMPDGSVVVCAPAFTKARPAGKKLLETAPLILNEPDGKTWRAWLKRQGIARVSLKGGQTCDDGLVAVDAAIAGAGLALTLRTLVEPDVQAGRLVMPFTDALETEFQHCLVMGAERRGRPATQKFIDWIVSECQSGTQV